MPHYLRAKEGDGETIAPSLYAGRAARRKSDAPEAVPVPPAPGGAVVASAEGKAAAVEPSTNTPAPPFVISNAAGLPIDNPFTS